MLCKRCKEDRKQDDFEFRKDRACYRQVCKKCKNERSRKKYSEVALQIAKKRKDSRNEKSEELNAKARERYWKNRNDLLEKAKRRPGYKKSNAKAASSWRMKNKEKTAAQQCVSRAVKSGKLVKAHRCSLCGSLEKLNAHHTDYAKPLEVIWLCTFCHKKVHSKYFKQDS